MTLDLFGFETDDDAIQFRPIAPCLTNQPKKHRTTSLSCEVEQMIRTHNIPYVSVDEAKKALFNKQKLRAFHFVVYGTDSKWLLLCAEATKENREQMTNWQQVFGDGFMAVFAVIRAKGISFRDFDGDKLELSSLRGAW
jgi:hypothetical protein